jgi:hypothetical protein
MVVSPVPVSVPGQRNAPAWLVLAGASAAFLAFDVVHAASRGLSGPMSVLYGLVLTGLAVGLGIIAGSRRRDRLTRVAAAAAMLIELILSADAAAAVVAPAAPGMLHLLFAAALAVSLLAALRTIMVPQPGAAAGPTVLAVGHVIPPAPGGTDSDSRVPAGTGLAAR